MNGHALIRTVDKSAVPNTWLNKQRRKFGAQDTLRT